MQTQTSIANIADNATSTSNIDEAPSFQALAPIARIYRESSPEIQAQLESQVIKKVESLAIGELNKIKNRTGIQSFTSAYNSIVLDGFGWDPRNKPAGIKELEGKIFDKINEITTNEQQMRQIQPTNQVRDSNSSENNNLDYIKSRIESARCLDDLREPVADFAQYKENSQVMSTLAKKLKILIEREMGCMDYSKHYIEKLERISKSYESFFQNSGLSNSNQAKEVRKKLGEQIETVNSCILG